MNKKSVIIMLSAIILIGLGVSAYCLYNSNSVNFLNRGKVEREKKEARKALEDYMQCIPKKEYEKMYNKLERVCRASNAKETFIERNKKIYEGIEAKNIKIKVLDTKKDTEHKDTYKVKYMTSMTVVAGEIEPFENTAVFVKEKDDKWGLKWDHNLIFPDLSEDTRVTISTSEPKRGRILDRNGKVLARNDKDGKREYPQGKACSHVVGYVQNVTAEDLKEHQDEDFYDGKSVIGRKGLENAFEERLRGKKGLTVAITDKYKTIIKVLAEIKGSDGEDIKTTLDVRKQKIVYNTLKNEMAASVWIDPKNGDILAMVSTPSYDPVTKKTSAPERKSPYFNRFASAYCPGSSFKPLNAGIGVTSGSYTTSTVHSHEGTDTYSKKNWGKYSLRNTHVFSGPFNLHTALVQSDNIWFGLAALDIGKEKLAKGLDKLGFNKKLPFEMKGFVESSYGDIKTMSSDAGLANTGFGQGELLVNPLHMASIYSAFVNNGNMVKPHIELKKGGKVEYYKKKVFSKKAVDAIVSGLKGVVNEGGTGKAAAGCSPKMAGKTGTAELKARRGIDGKENGWFNGFTYGTKKPILYITMEENVGHRGKSAKVVQDTRRMVQKMY